MENAYIINELTQGMELARQLKAILSSECSPESKHALIQGIISSYNRALLIINSAQPELPAMVATPVLSQPESPVSINESQQSGDFNQAFDNSQDQKVVSKKRKAMMTWKNQIRISTDNGLEGNSDDGYSWRKYGQKDILGAKFPRSYYRCTYRYVHNCMARKQVQRTDEDPTVFEITYRGQHTCTTAATTSKTVVPPQSPEGHVTIQNNHHQPPLPQKSDEILSNLRENLRVNTSDLDAMVPCSFSFPSSSFGCIDNYQQFDNSFLQIVDSGSNYFPEWNHGFHSDDSNLSGMISTTTSATNSPLAFPTEPQDFCPNFPFNNSGFFI
ncbi:hypothetical protein L2E82_47821 [Cichorium intybus]|uniref:Uncharacterized protein n=1 Tax=Cichorium intybus TaxID=13427 RepID=A0ACB8YXA1_CICIN|nr:hypothetical protein L2E82_47821 [Cichorium intybus]